MFSPKPFVVGLLVLVSTVVPQLTWAQTVHGRVFVAGTQYQQAIGFARVVQLGTESGALTDSSGHFHLQLVASGLQQLVVIAEGFATDTFTLEGYRGQMLKLELTQVTDVEGATVTARQRSSFIQTLDPMQTERLTSAEFTKAACCNLGESFETNASVDVNYTDAISGAKTINMLGLNGVYTNLLVEGLPWFNGLGRTFGLNYIAGPWLGSVQISKGTGPAVLGYETLTGQINLALKSPEDEQTLVNLFVNDYGRTELNLNHHTTLSERFSASVLLHGSTVPTTVDRNADGFLDTPLQEQGNVFFRLRYRGFKGWEGQLAVQALRENRRGGQASVYDNDDPSGYRLDVTTTRLAYFSKTGYVWKGKPYQSIGLQTSGVYHESDGVFGFKRWNGLQRRWTANLIFQSALGDTRHTYRVGLAYQFDQFHEAYNGQPFNRTESVPGLYAEYTFAPNDGFTAVAGTRVDFHNLYGTFVLPRLNLRYQAAEGLTLRSALGRGFRTANPFADNSPTLTSNRAVLVVPNLRPEVGWNAGLSAVYTWQLGLREASLAVDYYHTWFENQVLVDYDRNPQGIFIENLNGQSRAHSFQAELNAEPAKLLDVKVAYKFYDVRAPFDGQVQQVMLTPRHRGLLNIGYRLRRWRLDYTQKFIGTQRLHGFDEHHPGFELRPMAPAYALTDAQATFLPSNRWEVYLGAENLFNYTQPNPIIDADQPFGPFFDTSYVWGPILGRVVYLGIRLTVPSKK